MIWRINTNLLDGLITTAVLQIEPINDTNNRHHDVDSHGRFIDKTMNLQCYMIHNNLLMIPKPLIFQWKKMQMSSPQPSGYSKTLIIDSQQPPADSKTINISMEKRANVFACLMSKLRLGTARAHTTSRHPRKSQALGSPRKSQFPKQILIESYKNPTNSQEVLDFPF